MLKGLTSVVDNFCRSQDSNPQPRVTSPTLYPLGQGWFGQFGTITKAPSSLILYNTSGCILIGGKAYSLAAGQCDVRASPSSGEWDREKNSGQCAFSLVANRSNSPLSKRVQIIQTDSGCNLHSPWGIPFLESMSAPRFRRPGMCAALMERKIWSARSRRSAACSYRGLEQHANQYMPLFQLWLKIL